MINTIQRLALSWGGKLHKYSPSVYQQTRPPNTYIRTVRDVVSGNRRLTCLPRVSHSFLPGWKGTPAVPCSALSHTDVLFFCERDIWSGENNVCAYATDVSFDSKRFFRIDFDSREHRSRFETAIRTQSLLRRAYIACRTNFTHDWPSTPQAADSALNICEVSEWNGGCGLN